jgi:phosphate transport system permease protein
MTEDFVNPPLVPSEVPLDAVGADLVTGLHAPAAGHPGVNLEDEPITVELPVIGATTELSTIDDAEAPREPDRRPRRKLVTHMGLGDRAFRLSAWSGGLFVLAVMVVVGLFLLLNAIKALRVTGFRFLTNMPQQWQPDSHNSHSFGIAAVLFFTVAIAIVALIVAVPIAIGTALFISEVAPRRFKPLFVSLVDLMAAVPSIIYGMWGLFFFQAHVIGLSRWLSTWMSWMPLFRVEGADPSDPLAKQSVYTASTFIAGVVVGLMVVPISCSIMREVFSQAPSGEREGAYALGATRWGMVRTVVLPFGRGGMIGAIMLGLGRALGETIAVYLIISPVFQINWHILESGSNSVAALIVLHFGDASGFGLSALMAAGFALFALTLVVNFVASAIIVRSRSGTESEV